MSAWNLTAKEFYRILKDIQDYRCFLSGKELDPDSTSIVFKVPLSKGGKREPENVCLVHSMLAPLARRFSVAEIREICLAVNHHANSPKVRKPSGVPKKKADWHLALDRVKNFNRPGTKGSKPKRKERHSWGSAATDEIRKINAVIQQTKS